VESLLGVIGWLDRQGTTVLLPVLELLAVYILLSGLDDAALDLAWLWRKRRGRAAAAETPAPEKRIVIFLPLWQEAEVIETMLGHNLASIRYGNYEILAGVYANDDGTRAAVERVAARDARVRVAVVPHDGPTSKADCLNWVFQRLLEQELQGRPAAEVILIHDAEDLIHPGSLALINRLVERAEMVQVPVLALATPLRELTHGVYCDDFAESQTKDLDTRAWLGAFLPGCGVGTAFRREALERLAEAESNRLFDPLALTEDYDNGLRIHELGLRQMFVPLQWSEGAPLATREYFPRNFRAAVRQRTRWVTGNCLQAWQRHGWGLRMRHPWLQAWFFWRDRKVLWGSWIGLLSNAVFLWSLTSWVAAAGGQWRLGQAIAGHTWLASLLAANLVFCCQRLGVRMYCSARIYGWRFAAGAPVRMVWGNLINAAAAAGAVWQFAKSRWTGQPLRWLKTEHCYPSLESLRPQTEAGGLFAAAAAAAGGGALPVSAPFESGEAGRAGCVSLEDLSDRSWPERRAWPTASPMRADRRILRTLPADLSVKLGVVPVGLNGDCLEIAAAEEIRPEIRRQIAWRVGLPVQFVRASEETLRRLRDERDAPPARGCPGSLQRIQMPYLPGGFPHRVAPGGENRPPAAGRDPLQ